MPSVGLAFIAGAFVLLSAAPSFAQKVPVHLDTSVNPDDFVGQRLAFEMKEAIRSSHGFRLVEDSTDWPYIRHSFVALKLEGGATVVSHTFTYDATDMPLSGALITTYVQTCGSSVVQACARNMLAALDRAVESLKQRMPRVIKALR